MILDNLLGNLHRFMREVGETKWFLAAATLATRGLHMLSYSFGNLPHNVLDVSPHCQSNTYY